MKNPWAIVRQKAYLGIVVVDTLLV